MTTVKPKSQPRGAATSRAQATPPAGSDDIPAEMLLRAQAMAHVGTWVATLNPATAPVGDSMLWSDEMYRLSGLEPQETPASFELFLWTVHPDDRDRVRAVVGGAMQTGTPYRFDYRVATPSGRLRVLHSRGSFEFDPTGKIVRILGTSMDVTDRYRAEHALVESDARLRAVFEQSAVGMVVAGGDGTLLQVNRSFAEFLGYSVAELEGRMLSEITYGNDLTKSPQHGGTLPTYDKRYVRRDGTTVWARVTASRLHVQGKPDAFMGVVQDIDAQKHASEVLARQTEILRGMLDHLPVMVLRVSADGALIYSNREARRVFGWSEAGMPADIIASAFPDAEEREHVRRMMQAGKAEWLDFEPRAGDGRAVPSSWASITLSDGASLVIGQDLTERRQLQETLAQSQKLEAIGQLAGGIAHDFNNLLTVISAGATFVQEAAGDNTELQSDAKDILDACNRAASLTRQLLAFSRRQLLHPEVLSANEVVHGLSSTLRRLLSESIALEVSCEAEQPRVEVDRTQLEQVIINLAVNARDAIGEHGTITVHTTNAKDPLGRGELVLQVIDDGAGIGPEIMQRIFEPFFTTKPVGKGTGLGLATVHGIVEQSGGRIAVESTPGKGTTFSVHLPSADAVALAPRSSVDQVSRAAKGTILLVEDEGTIRVIARRMLTSMGYTVIEARHGRDGLQLAWDAGDTIDLLVTDVIMPEMGGRELATALRAQRPHLPVLYMSGYTDDELLRRGVLEPSVRLLRKPFEKDELRQCVHELLTCSAAPAA